MKFTKMQGCGNDYVYVNCFEEQIDDRPALARFVSDRHFGVGSDGLICICPSEMADFQMDMYNLDGTQSQMCGNGIRCVGKYVYDHGMTTKHEITVESHGVVKQLKLCPGPDDKIAAVCVGMGAPELRPQFIPIAEHGSTFISKPVVVDGQEFFVTCLSVGNPHAVTFLDNIEHFDLAKWGPKFENHPLFPEKVNAEFVQVLDENTLRMRVWERGCGETLACGTGATASMVAANLCGYVGTSAAVQLRGGELFIEWDRKQNEIYMTGPAVTVFDGELYL